MPIYSGSCHCSRVRFEVDIASWEDVFSCDCSICRRRGALMKWVSPDDFKMLTALEDCTVYQWNTKTATDYFCPSCGILGFRRPRAAPHLWAVNVRCLHDVDLDGLEIVRADGSTTSVVE